ncbi:MAG: M23 family metallopeptidase [Polyangiales bacterium]
MRALSLVGAGLLALAALPARPVAQPLGVAPVGAVGGDGAVLADVNAEVARLEGESRRLDAEAASLTPRKAALEARARVQTRWLYHMTQGDALVAHAGPEVLLDHAARAARVRRVLHATLASLEQAGARSRALEDDRRRVAGLLSAARARRTQIEAQERALMARALGASATAAPEEAPSVTVYGGAPAALPGVETFSQSAGRLLFPVAGRARVQRAWREGAEGPGLEIAAPVGTPVRTVFPGRVAFSDRYGGYGRIVIVDHGEHYYTVSANLARIDVQVGQELETGQTLGTVGDESGRGPMLYFEVRHGGETIDPVPWLGL